MDNSHLKTMDAEDSIDSTVFQDFTESEEMSKSEKSEFLYEKVEDHEESCITSDSEYHTDSDNHEKIDYSNANYQQSSFPEFDNTVMFP